MKNFQKGELILAEKPFATGREISSDKTSLGTWETNSQKREANAPDRVEMVNNICEMDMNPLETYKLSLLFNGKNGKKLKKTIPSMDVFRYDEVTPTMKSCASPIYATLHVSSTLFEKQSKKRQRKD